MRKLLWGLALLLCSGWASAACTLVVNTPLYSYQTLPGQPLRVTVNETGCPSSSITAISAAPSGSDSIITYTGSFTSFTVGKFAIVTTGLLYPFDLIQAAGLEILSANSTTLTAKYVGHNISFGSTAVTGTIIQASKINWSVATTTGTQTATLGCTSNCPAETKVTMGAVNGHCSLSAVNPYPMTCTQAVTVTATAVDGGSAVSFPIYGAGVTTNVQIDGAYKQLYENQVGRLQTQVFGNANHNINWTHTGSCTVIGPSNKRDIYFYSATSQHCTFTATSAADGSKTDTRLIYIVATAIPAYGAGPEKTPPVPCEVDATLTGTVYNVGPTQSLTTINAVPFNTWTGGGHIVRIHNEDTGTSPTTFHEYIQPGFDAATATNPDYICGVANALGYHPVMDGDNAHGPTYANVNLYGTGMISTFPSGCSGNFPSASCTPNYLAIAGLTIIHANSPYTGFKADGTTPFDWGDGSSAINFRTGTHLEAYANHCRADSQCVGSYDNGDDHGWVAITFAVSEQRNFADTMGFSGSFLSHPFYMQSFGMELWGNLINAPVAGSSGSCIKIRGVGVDTVNNYCSTGFARHKDWVEVQDAAFYTNIDNYVNNGAWPTDTLNADVIVGYLEELLDDNVELGNAVNDPGFFGNARHFMGDHDDNLNHMGMNARYGILTSAYETYYGCGQVFDTNGLSPTDDFWLAPEWQLSNSTIICPSGNFHFNTQATAVVTAQTNLYLTGTVDNSLSIYGGRYNNGDSISWTSDWSTGQFLFAAPMETHLNGNLTTDYLIAPSVPFNTTTLVPGSSSPLVGAATTLSGEAALFNLAYNAVALDGSIALRTDLSTIGAYDPSGGPTVTSVVVTDNSNVAPLSVVTGATTQGKAIAHWSDSTTTNVTSTATWGNGSSTHFDVSKQFYQNLQNLGAGAFTVQSGTSCCGGLNVGNTTGTAFSQASPSLSGKSIKAVTTGDSYNMQVYLTGLDCTVLPGGDCSGVTDIWAEFSAYLPSGMSVLDAFEGPNFTNYTGTTHQYPSVQCNGTTWDLWNPQAVNPTTGGWVNSGFACTNFLTVTNTWHDIRVHYQINQGANTLTYVELDFDGTPVFTGGTTTFNGEAFVSSAAAKAQFQLDGGLGGSSSTTAYVDNWTVTVSPGTPGLVTGLSVGSGTVTATYLTVPGTATVNDVAPAASAVLSGSAKISGSGKLQ